MPAQFWLICGGGAVLLIVGWWGGHALHDRWERRQATAAGIPPVEEEFASTIATARAFADGAPRHVTRLYPSPTTAAVRPAVWAVTNSARSPGRHRRDAETPIPARDGLRLLADQLPRVPAGDVR